MRADLLLMDDHGGQRAARQHGLRVTGALGVLATAAESAAWSTLAAFRRPEALPRALLDKGDSRADESRQLPRLVT